MDNVQGQTDHAGEKRKTAQDTLYASLIALRHGFLLVPNSAMADVLWVDCLQPSQTRGLPRIGTAPWHGQLVPVIDFDVLLRGDTDSPMRRPRLVVLHALSQTRATKAYAILCDGQPQLIVLNSAALQPLPSQGDEQTHCVLGRVRISTREALIPDFEQLECEVAGTQAAFP